MIPPKISIILPVYNVAPYLRQCLDSVVNQTMRDIQIICVNDGSTDGSHDILREYAAQDSRFEIITQENRGAGSARNAAFPFIKGKYAYFADPDDWLNLELCEKALKKIEETEVDVVYLQGIRELPGKQGKTSHKLAPNLPDVRTSPDERIDLLCHYAPWVKFWKSDFLFEHQIQFSDGKRPANDVFQSWQGIVLANRIAVLDEPLYHYRCLRPGSYQESFNPSHFTIVDTMNEVETFLRKSGKYDAYKDQFHTQKLAQFFRCYRGLPVKLQQEFREKIRQNLTLEDREYFYNGKVKRRIARFYKVEIDGTPFEQCVYRILSSIRRFVKPKRKVA